MGGDSKTAVSPSALAHAMHREPLQATFLAPRHSTKIHFKQLIMSQLIIYFSICFGGFRLCMIIRKLIIHNVSDWECLAGGFWGMAAVVSAMCLYDH